MKCIYDIKIRFVQIIIKRVTNHFINKCIDEHLNWCSFITSLA